MHMTELTDTSVMAENAISTQPQPAQATTANEATGLVFPKIAQHFEAFWEREACMSEAPSIEILELMDDFWALTVGHLGSPESPTAFVASENVLLRQQCVSGKTAAATVRCRQPKRIKLCPEPNSPLPTSISYDIS